ncbi:hypothetical protein Q9L58_010492 [Maublancomyces gigas]|uniref:Uncharacterized protein n=1 Tax=Discina gigas TaxID=1032678 RepID=A0ABR3G405_9PEZI
MLPVIQGASTFQRKSQVLRDGFFAANVVAPPMPESYLPQPTQDLSDARSTLTYEEIRETIRKRNGNSAIGPDGVSYEMPKHVMEADPNILTNLFTNLLKHASKEKQRNQESSRPACRQDHHSHQFSLSYTHPPLTNGHKAARQVRTSYMDDEIMLHGAETTEFARRILQDRLDKGWKGPNF